MRGTHRVNGQTRAHSISLRNSSRRPKTCNKTGNHRTTTGSKWDAHPWPTALVAPPSVLQDGVSHWLPCKSLCASGDLTVYQTRAAFELVLSTPQLAGVPLRLVPHPEEAQTEATTPLPAYDPARLSCAMHNYELFFQSANHRSPPLPASFLATFRLNLSPPCGNRLCASIFLNFNKNTPLSPARSRWKVSINTLHLNPYLKFVQLARVQGGCPVFSLVHCRQRTPCAAFATTFHTQLHLHAL